MIIVFQNGSVRQLGHETIYRDLNRVYCKIDKGELLLVGVYKSGEDAEKVMKRFVFAISCGKPCYQFPSEYAVV